jgi:hypothetical protein
MNAIPAASKVVRALDGTTISEGSFKHLPVPGGLIVRTEIQNVKAFLR